jgi:predicted nucleic acid-binding protein
MRAVSNTSPISALAIIDRLPLLKLQFTELWIPTSVSEELAAHPEHSAGERIQSALREGWIKVATPTNSSLLGILSEELHRGEAEE